jgi:hypothetical protein
MYDCLTNQKCTSQQGVLFTFVKKSLLKKKGQLLSLPLPEFCAYLSSPYRRNQLTGRRSETGKG